MDQAHDNNSIYFWIVVHSESALAEAFKSFAVIAGAVPYVVTTRAGTNPAPLKDAIEAAFADKHLFVFNPADGAKEKLAINIIPCSADHTRKIRDHFGNGQSELPDDLKPEGYETMTAFRLACCVAKQNVGE